VHQRNLDKATEKFLLPWLRISYITAPFLRKKISTVLGIFGILILNKIKVLKKVL